MRMRLRTKQRKLLKETTTPNKDSVGDVGDPVEIVDVVDGKQVDHAELKEE